MIRIINYDLLIWLNIACLVLIGCLSNAFAQVVLSEIMIDPAGSERTDEFVELFNISDSIIDLSGWEIGDGRSFDALAPVEEPLLLHPGQYGLILDGNYVADSATTYENIIPPETLILQIDGATFGSGGFSNSTGETVCLINAAADTLECYTYMAGMSPGFSLEKINNFESGIDNWDVSLTSGGTPGRLNSRSPVEIDFAISAFKLLDPPWIAGGDIEFSATIQNHGRQTTAGVEWQIFLDDNGNNRPDYNEVIATGIPPTLPVSDDSLLIGERLSGLSFGETVLGLYLQVTPPDDRPENNTRMLPVFIDDPRHIEIVFNELLVAPRLGESEWVELYNAGDTAVPLEWLLLADLRDTVRITTGPIILEPGRYIVVASDDGPVAQYRLDSTRVISVSGMPSLNNQGDALSLLGGSGFVYDAVDYTGDWYGREVEAGISLEKLNPLFSGQLMDNWAASVDPRGATPTQENSVFIDSRALQKRIRFQPNPFSPDGDGHDDFTAILFEIPVATAFLNVRLFNLTGHMVRHLQYHAPVSHQGQLVWDGKDDRGQPAPIGAYICLFEFLNNDRSVFDKAVKTVILMKN